VSCPNPFCFQFSTLECQKFSDRARLRTGTPNEAGNKQTKDNKMIMTLTVFKEVHNAWPAKNGKPAGESYDLLCMDNSNPPEHRMEEMLYSHISQIDFTSWS
jgi:hypothetical protein